jgi:hypothetical protein
MLVNDLKKCWKCDTLILWKTHKVTGKAAPIELEPSPIGNVLVKGTQYRIATAEEIEKAKKLNIGLHLNHFASCPEAESFRRK